MLVVMVNSNSELVMVSSEHCGFCKQALPYTKNTCSNYGISLKIMEAGKLPSNIKEPDLLPYFIVIKDGKQIDSWSGFLISKISKKIHEHFGKLK